MAINFPDSPSSGDTFTDATSGFTFQYNGTVWRSFDPSTAANIREIDNISGDFDGSETDFTLKVAGVNVEPANVQQLIISVGGVMQNAGQDYTLSGSTLTFTTAPTSGLTFFGVLLGTALSLNTIADGSVGRASLSTTTNYLMNGLTLDQGAGILTAFGFKGGSVTADLDSTFSANVSIAGSLTVQGTQTIINTDELNVQDKTIGIGSTNAPTSTTQDDAGVIIYGQTNVNLLYDRDKAALGISTGLSVSGFVTATSAKVGTGVTINNTGIDAGNAGIVTAGTIAAPSALILKSEGAPTEEVRIASNGRVGINSTVPTAPLNVQAEGTTGTCVRLNQETTNQKASIYFQDSATTGNDSWILNEGTDLSVYAGYSGKLNLGAYLTNGVTVLSTGLVGVGTDTPVRQLEVAGSGANCRAQVRNFNGGIGSLYVDDSDNVHVVSGANPGNLTLDTVGTERLSIDSNGGFTFSNAQLTEKVNIVAGKLSDNPNIDLADGMVHYFTTQDTGICTPDIRINSSTTLNSVMDAGDVITVTLISTAAAAAYSANLTIDTVAVTEEWVGGSAPSEGGADGLDIYTYTIICTHNTNTGDSGFKVIANLTNATN